MPLWIYSQTAGESGQSWASDASDCCLLESDSHCRFRSDYQWLLTRTGSFFLRALFQFL